MSCWFWTCFCSQPLRRLSGLKADFELPWTIASFDLIASVDARVLCFGAGSFSVHSGQIFRAALFAEERLWQHCVFGYGYSPSGSPQGSGFPHLGNDKTRPSRVPVCSSPGTRGTGHVFQSSTKHAACLLNIYELEPRLILVRKPGHLDAQLPAGPS